MSNLEKLLIKLIGSSEDRSEYQTYPEWEEENVLVERKVLIDVLEDYKKLLSLVNLKAN